LSASSKPRLSACATSAPSTPSCAWWRLFAVRLGSGVGRCRRWPWRMRCWTSACARTLSCTLVGPHGGCSHSPSGREPADDSFGDRLPSRLKHHVVAHVGEEFTLSPVSPRRSRHIPVANSRAVLFCAENKHRCGHKFSFGRTDKHLIQSSTRALGLHTGGEEFDDEFGGVPAEQEFTGQGRCINHIG
jgi:hypothetical protein